MTVLKFLRNVWKPTPIHYRLLFTSHERPKTCIQSLPNELLLEIFSFLDLKSYIKCHLVCKDWLRLIPSTQMDPIRERLHDLFREILGTPDFEKAFEWTDQNLQSFDREEYISYLLKQYPAVPEEFRMWILEWPARLAIQSVWPGLPFMCCGTINSIVRQSGVNWIAHRPFTPQLLSLVYKEYTPSETFIPALLIWREATELDWLVFEQDDPFLFGRVYRTDMELHSSGGIPYYPPREHANDGDAYSDYSEGEEYLSRFTFDDWIDFLEYLWDATSEQLRRPRKPFSIGPDIPISQPVVCEFHGGRINTLPAPAWDSIQRTMPR